jgi:hypothetical protein
MTCHKHPNPSNDLLFFVLTSWAPYNSNAQMTILTADETNLATRASSDSVNVSGNKLKQQLKLAKEYGETSEIFTGTTEICNIDLYSIVTVH